MARQRVVRGLFVAICAPILGFSPALAYADNYEINIGGIGYRYDEKDADLILRDSPYRTPGATQYYINKEADYPNTGTDASIAMGAASALVLLRSICSSDPDCHVSGFGASNGSDALSELNDILIETNDPLMERLKLYLMVNPRDPYSGITTRFPEGSTIPLTEITAGSPTQIGGASVVSFRNEYDPISDFPDHPFNLLTDINAFLAFYLVHPQVNANVLDPRNVVTSTPDGRFVSVLVHTEILPILQPFTSFLPQEVIKVLDMLLRPIIDSAYTRPEPSAPTVQVAQAEVSVDSEPVALASVAPLQGGVDMQRTNGAVETPLASEPNTAGVTLKRVASVPSEDNSSVKITEPNVTSEPIQAHETTGGQDEQQSQQEPVTGTIGEEESKPKVSDEDTSDQVKADKSSHDPSDSAGQSPSSSGTTQSKTDSDKTPSKPSSSEGSSNSGSSSSSSSGNDSGGSNNP